MALVLKYRLTLKAMEAEQLSRLEAAFADPKIVDCCLCGKTIPVEDPCCLTNWNQQRKEK